VTVVTIEPKRRARRRDRQTLLLGALIRRVPVRLLDLSLDGCLLASPAMLAVGTTGRLDVTLRDGRRVQAIRVCRASRLKGRSWPYRIAAQYLNVTGPSAASLRQLASEWGSAADQAAVELTSSAYDG
jgi:hypothetical protein